MLGVDRAASDAEVRRAYLRLARRHHPDFHTAGSEGEVGSAETRMREINRAWEVLGTPESRAAYDRSLDGGRPGAGVAATGGSPGGSDTVIRPPSSEFRPYFDDDEDDDDSWRYEPDEGDPDSVPPRGLLMAPPALGLAGVVLIAVSLAAKAAPIAVVGAVCLVLSALLFLTAPVVAMFLGARTEERARRRR